MMIQLLSSDPNKLALSQADNHQDVELDKADGRNHEQVYRGDVRRMIGGRPPGF
jgi:hypothetical protein